MVTQFMPLLDNTYKYYEFMISSISYDYKQFVVPFMLQMKITNSLKMNSNNMSQSGEHTGLFEQ